MSARVRTLFIGFITGLLFLSMNCGLTFATPKDPSKHAPFIFGNDQHMILIDAGHGGVDGGTSYGRTLEKDITLAISRKLYLILRSNGMDAALNRFGDYAPSDENHWFRSSSRHQRDLTQRKGLADTLPTSVVVSIHVNWAPVSSIHGPLVLYKKEGRSFMLANAIQHQLNRLYKVDAYSKRGKPYFLLNQITATTVIVEAGFISSPIDRAKLFSRSGQQAIAEAIANGIAAYLMEV